MPIFEVLTMMFEVGRTTAHDIFHYWLLILRDLLPCSLLENWQKLSQNDEFVQQLLTSHELLVDSAEQPRKRPKNYQEQTYLVKTTRARRQLFYCHGGEHNFSEMAYSKLVNKKGRFG